MFSNPPDAPQRLIEHLVSKRMPSAAPVTAPPELGKPIWVARIHFRGTTPSAPHFGPPIRVAQKINPMAGPQNH
jgi:hypothetical protein